MFYLEKILPYNLDQTRLQKRGEWHLPSWYTDSLFFSVGIVEHEEKLTIKPKGLQEVLAVTEKAIFLSSGKWLLQVSDNIILMTYHARK